MAKKTKKIAAPKGAELKLDPIYKLKEARRKAEFDNYVWDNADNGYTRDARKKTPNDYKVEKQIKSAFSSARKGKTYDSIGRVTKKKK